MRHRGSGSRGIALLELVIVVAFLAVIAGITIPLFSLAVSRARSAGVAEALGATIRDARARAVATGFQYRVVAFDASGAVPNAFRIEGMDPANGGAFPAPTTTTPPAFYGVNQMYEPYVNLPRDYPGTQVLVPGGTFTVTFNSSGQQVLPCVPAACTVQVTNQGRVATLTVSVAGAVRIDK